MASILVDFLRLFRMIFSHVFLVDLWKVFAAVWELFFEALGSHFWYFANVAENGAPHESIVNSSQIEGRTIQKPKRKHSKAR